MLWCCVHCWRDGGDRMFLWLHCDVTQRTVIWTCTAVKTWDHKLSSCARSQGSSVIVVNAIQTEKPRNQVSFSSTQNPSWVCGPPSPIIGEHKNLFPKAWNITHRNIVLILKCVKLYIHSNIHSQIVLLN